MDSLHKLSKQMDALTYNARNVVNALIRSTMTSGSYNGYTVSRAGKEIKLSRVDVYRLYTFYQEWEYHYSYAKADFDTLRTTHDAKYLRVAEDTDNTTEALIKHSQILYLTPENVENFSDGDYWLDLLRENANPKQIANSCPIPLNLRSPIYDENLSTKHFSQFETYLFPTGYYEMGLLGYYNDAIDHIGGGKSWTWEVNNNFNVHADSTILGYHNPELKSIKEAPMASVESPAYRVMTGLECYAYGLHTFSGGLYCTAYGDEAFAFGNRNLSVNENTATLGGANLMAVCARSASVGGEWNRSVAVDSFTANYKACTGGAQWFFKKLIVKEETDTSTETETTCPSSIVENGCTYKLAVDANGNTVETGSSSTAANNVIYIDYDEVGGGNLAGNNTHETKYKTNHLDFIVGDNVILYGFRLNTPGYSTNDSNSPNKMYARFYGDGSRATVPIIATVTNLVKNDTEQRFEITLSRDVLIDGVDITAGYVTLYTANRHISTMMNDGAASTATIGIASGMAATALNYYTRAVGPAQTVVGSLNEPMFEPRFIVGSGPRLSESEDTHRSGRNYTLYGPGNSFVSGPRYTYMKVHSSYIMLGVSEVTNKENAIIHTSEKIVADESANLGIYMLSGAYSMVWNDRHTAAGISRVDKNRAQLTISDEEGDSGVIVHPVEYDEDTGKYGGNAPEVHNKQISTLIGGKKGSTVIYAGTDPENTANDCYYDRFKYSGAQSVPTNKVAVYAEDGITLDTTGTIYMQALRPSDGQTNSYIDMYFEEIRMAGRTYGTLTGTCDARSFNIAKDTDSVPEYMAHNRIGHSGFFFNWCADDVYHHGIPTGMSAYVNCDAYHSINSAYIYDITTNSHYQDLIKYAGANPGVSKAIDTSTLILPGGITYNSASYGTPHIQFVTNTIYGDGNSNVEPEGPSIKETLAYMSDLDVFWKHSELISMAAGYATEYIGTTTDSSGNTYVVNEGLNTKLYIIGKNTSNEAKVIRNSANVSAFYNVTDRCYLGSSKNTFISHLRLGLSGNTYTITGTARIYKPGKISEVPTDNYYGMVFTIFPSFKVDSSYFIYKGTNHATENMCIYGRMYYNYDSTAQAIFNTDNGMFTVCIQWGEDTMTSVSKASEYLEFPFSLTGVVPFKSAELYDSVTVSDSDIKNYWVAVGSVANRVWGDNDIKNIWGLTT